MSSRQYALKLLLSIIVGGLGTVLLYRDASVQESIEVVNVDGTRSGLKSNDEASTPPAVPAPTRAQKEVLLPEDVVAQNELESLLKRGDSSAAVEAFHRTQECYHASQALTRESLATARCAGEYRQNFQEVCSREIARYALEHEIAESQARHCSSISAPDLTSLRYKAARAAAKAGDTDAQLCLIDGNFDRRLMALSDEELEQHQIETIYYFENGLERGDWRVAQAMTMGSQALSHARGLESLLVNGDDLTIYRMLRLLRFGARGEYATTLDARLREYTDARLNGLEGFDPVKLAEADAWARVEFERNFTKSTPLDRPPEVCPSSLGAD